MRAQKRPKKKIQRENNERRVVSQRSILVQFDAKEQEKKTKKNKKKKIFEIPKKLFKKTPKQNFYNTDRREKTEKN